MKTSILGQKTDYPKQYCPDILYAIPRKGNRPPFGEDIWTAYELSWLNKQGLPQVAILELKVPVSSTNIIESKSLKLYLNSLNNVSFESTEKLLACIQKDLEKNIKTTCSLTLYESHEWEYFTRKQPEGLCIETALSQQHNEVIDQTLYTHLFRSVCPVTGQPDWATLILTYTGKWIDPKAFLTHILTYRDHPGFHEECIDTLFWHIQKTYTPDNFSIQGLFTRRGGIDINPHRATQNTIQPLYRSHRQ